MKKIKKNRWCGPGSLIWRFYVRVMLVNGVEVADVDVVTSDRGDTIGGCTGKGKETILGPSCVVCPLKKNYNWSSVLW